MLVYVGFIAFTLRVLQGSRLIHEPMGDDTQRTGAALYFYCLDVMPTGLVTVQL